MNKTLYSIIVFSLGVIPMTIDAQKNGLKISTTNGEEVYYKMSEIKEFEIVDSDSLTKQHGTIDEHDYVDLGLSVLWATCNIGANKPYKAGDYFAWGETDNQESKKNIKGNIRFCWENYKYIDGQYIQVTKYNFNSKESYVVDKKEILESKDDAATVKWGSNWRMPTKEEVEELVKGCDVTWVNDYQGRGVNGYVVTSNINGYIGNYIFLPAGGFYNESAKSQNTLNAPDLLRENYVGHYWTANLNTEKCLNAYYLSLGADAFGLSWGTSKGGDLHQEGGVRFEGFNIRPVSNKNR